MNVDLNRRTATVSDCAIWQLLNGTTVTRHHTDTGRQENLIRPLNVSATPAADSGTGNATGTICSFARKLLVAYVFTYFVLQ